MVKALQIITLSAALIFTVAEVQVEEANQVQEVEQAQEAEQTEEAQESGYAPYGYGGLGYGGLGYGGLGYGGLGYGGLGYGKWGFGPQYAAYGNNFHNAAAAKNHFGLNNFNQGAAAASHKKFNDVYFKKNIEFHNKKGIHAKRAAAHTNKHNLKKGNAFSKKVAAAAQAKKIRGFYY